jgi:hypothetical protein
MARGVGRSQALRPGAETRLPNRLWQTNILARRVGLASAASLNKVGIMNCWKALFIGSFPLAAATSAMVANLESTGCRDRQGSEVVA